MAMVIKEIEKRLQKLEKEVARLKEAKNKELTSISSTMVGSNNQQALSRAIGMTANLIGKVRVFPAGAERDEAVGTARKILKLLRQFRGEKIAEAPKKPRLPVLKPKMVEKPKEEVKKLTEKEVEKKGELKKEPVKKPEAVKTPPPQPKPQPKTKAKKSEIKASKTEKVVYKKKSE